MDHTRLDFGAEVPQLFLLLAIQDHGEKRRRWSTSLDLEQSTACSSFALDITQFLQKTSEIISVWTILLSATTCILTTLALL